MRFTIWKVGQMKIEKTGTYVELKEGNITVGFWHFIPWSFFRDSKLWFFDTMPELRLMAEEMVEARMVLDYLNTLDDPRVPESKEWYDKIAKKTGKYNDRLSI